MRLLPAAILHILSVSAWGLQGDEGAAKKFQEVSKAYDTLRDPQKRQQYDSMGADGYERMAETGGAGWSPVSLGLALDTIMWQLAAPAGCEPAPC